VRLSEVSINSKVIINKFKFNDLFMRRILDIGILPGVCIKKVIVSPFGGIAAYDINGTLIAIRDSDAKNIEVAYV